MKLSFYRTRYDGIEDSYLLLPDGISYIASYVKKYLPDTEINLAYNSDRILANNPDLVALSGVSITMNDIRSIAKEIKRTKNIPVILGGVHITYLPDTLPQDVDIGVISEGEETFLELLQLAEKKELVPEKLKDVAGIVYRDYDGVLKTTRPRALFKDIDELPLPIREVSPDFHPLHQIIFTSRGCVYKCRYCVETNFWVKTRFHSTERVFAEICQIVRDFPDQKAITFGDTIFAVHKKRLREITELVVDAGINKKITFSCNARANIFDEETCELFLRMNMKQINFGFESASDDVLDFMKGKVSAQENQKALALCDKYNFIPLGHFLVASPVEKKEDLAKTYWYLRRNYRSLWRINVTPLIPFPGTEFWSQAKEKGLLDSNFADWDQFKIGEDPPILLNENYTKEDFSEMRVFFSDLLQKNRVEKGNIESYMAFSEYLEFVYQKLGAFIPEKSEVLEVSNNVTDLSFFGYPVGNISKIGTFNGNLELKKLESSLKFDLIVIVHALEQLINPLADLKKLKEKLNESGEIICLFYNSLNLDFFKLFLLKDGIDTERYWGPTAFKNLQFLSLKPLKKLFERVGLKKTEILYTGYNGSSASEAELEFIRENFSSATQELFSMSYIVKFSRET